MIVDENKPTPLNTPSKQDGPAVRPDVQAAVQKFLQARSGHPPKMVTNNFAAIWALEKERRRTSLRLKHAIEASAKTVSRADPCASVLLNTVCLSDCAA